MTGEASTVVLYELLALAFDHHVFHIYELWNEICQLQDHVVDLLTIEELASLSGTRDTGDDV